VVRLRGRPDRRRAPRLPPAERGPAARECRATHASLRALAPTSMHPQTICRASIVSTSRDPGRLKALESPAHTVARYNPAAGADLE
jgi:hypothetical protein